MPDRPSLECFWLLFFFIPCIILALLSRSLPVVSGIQVYMVGSPLPTTVRAFVFFARGIQHFFFPRRLASNWALRASKRPSIYQYEPDTYNTWADF